MDLLEALPWNLPGVREEITNTSVRVAGCEP
jgi:hypothetical protein